MQNRPIWGTSTQLEGNHICRGELLLLGLHQARVKQQLFIGTPP